MEVSFLVSTINKKANGLSTDTSFVRLLALFFSLLLSFSIHAKPWISQGDSSLRSDIQLLSDIGVIKSPVTTWPLNWSGIKKDLFEARNLKLDKEESYARQRVLRRSKYETRKGSKKKYRLGGNLGTTLFNSFYNEYTDGVGLTGKTDWLGSRFAANLQAATVIDARDDKKLRFDGSYAAVVLDNWIISVGAEQRWWGPGWGDSLLIGNNARALPGISLRRNHSKAPQSKLFSWIGPWHLDSFVARMESDREIEDAILLGVRFSFKPRSNIEFSLSRTSMFGGKENPTGISAIFSALRGDDEIDGEQNAVFSFDVIDARYALTKNFAMYGQYGETRGGQDDGGLGLLGIELTPSALLSKYAWKMYVEFVDTNLNDSGINSYLGEKYKNGNYYRGNGIGSNFVGQFALVGAHIFIAESELLSLSLRSVKLKKGSEVGQPEEDKDLIAFGAGYLFPLFRGKLSSSLQVYSEKVELNGLDSDQYSLALTWERGF